VPDISELNSWFKSSEDNQTNWKIVAKENLQFLLGNQWDNVDIEILEKQKRPHLTFNHILPRVNLIMGYLIQNRQDIKPYNKRGGTRQIAEILFAIIKHIHDNSLGNYETAMAFLLGIVCAKGYLGAYLDYDNDPFNGELRMENISPFNVFPDPYAEKYDWSDASFVFRTGWFPKKKIELLYPDKKDELESGFEVDSRDKIAITTDTGSSYKPNVSVGEEPMSDIDKYKYRIKQCWWREYESATFLYDVTNGQLRPTELKGEKLNAVLAQFTQLRKIKRVMPKIHLTTYVGNIELENMIPFEDRGGLKRFPIAPFYPLWIEEEFLSFVTNLKDPQREINKRYSQLLHHLNMTAGSGWIGAQDAVADWEKLEEAGGRPGISIKLNPGKKLGVDIDRINPVQLSEGHLVLAREGATQMNLVSGIDPSLFGILPETRESGIAMQVRQKQSITGLEPMYDNFRTTRQVFGRILIELIQKSGAYSKEEILRLVIDGEEKEYEINKKEEATGQILNNVRLGEYDCTVSETPSNPTARLARFYSLIEAVRAGIQLPPAMIIKASDFPDKEEALEQIQASQQTQQMQAKAEMDLKAQELKLKDKELNIKGQAELLKAGLREKEIGNE